MLKTPLKFIITIVLTLGLSMSFQSLLASWTAPTASPPGVNVDEPINRGVDYQDKLGSLGIGSNLGVGGRQIIGGEPSSVITGIKSYLEFDFHNDFSVAKTDSSRIYRDTTGYFTGNTNHDFLVFEKTDGNSSAPDGGMLFVNRNMSNDRELAFTIRGDGNIGIGTINPTAKLDVNGSINLSGGGRSVLANSGTASFGSTNSHTYIRSATSRNIYLQTGTSNRLTVLGNGNVGIGTTPSGAKLHVDGTIRASTPTEDYHVATKDYVDNEAGLGGGWPSGSYCIFRNGGSCPVDFTSSQISLLVGRDNHDHCEGRPKFAGDSSCQMATTNHYVNRLVLTFCCK